MKVNEKPCGAIPKVKVVYTPVLCNHCGRPACAEACPAGAIHKRDDGLVIINPEECAGCGACADACPYDVIYKNEEKRVCQKCTGCAHLLDNGYSEPRCAEVCPTGALRFGEEDEIGELIPGATVLRPEEGLSPNVYYRNVPGQFIAGLVYDPDEKEVIEHACVTAVTGGKIIRSQTDDFGDFWLNDLAIGRYDVTISAPGYAPKYFHDVRTDECVNLGDIPLEKTNERVSPGDIPLEKR
jgi:Fe-S-cluster-containing dehydrogenase component